MTTENLRSIENANSIAEEAARAGRNVDAKLAYVALGAALQAARAAGAAGDNFGDAAAAASVNAANTATYNNAPWETAAHAADDAFAAVYRFMSTADRAAAMWADFGLLEALAAEEMWTDDSPVDPDLLGPLWPGGTPSGFPPESIRADAIGGLRLTIEVPDDATEAEIAQRTADIVSRLDDIYRSIGGSGLRRLPPSDVYEPANVTQGVGS